MIPALKAIPAILLSIPMMAQSSWIANRIGHNRGASLLLHVGERGDPLIQELRALQGSGELADMSIVFESVQPASPNYAQIVRGLGLAHDSRWALADSNGRRLLQGNKPPSAAEIQNALDGAGLRSTTRILRDFLRQNPGHLEARWHLIWHLRSLADRRTRSALGLEINAEDPSVLLSTMSDSGIPDTSPLEGKQLTPEQDIRIWGPYAQEIQNIFDSGDWRLIHDLLEYRPQMFTEVCSPTVIQVYRRHFGDIESFLAVMPNEDNIWHYYGRWNSVIKRNSVQDLINTLTPLPNTEWPPLIALDILVSEERTRNNWASLADTLMSRWPGFRSNLYSRAAFISSNLSTSSGEDLPEGHTGLMSNWATGRLEEAWRSYLNPLLESLIRANRVTDAETIILDIARFLAYRDFQRRAAELARSCNRADLQTKWALFRISEKTAPDTDDLDAALYSSRMQSFGGRVFGTSPGLVAIGANSQQITAVDEILKHDLIIDWRIHRVEHLDPELSGLMRQREGWPGDTTYWALLDTKDKVVVHGPGLPTAAALRQALTEFNLETPAQVFRRFTNENPSIIEARLWFMRELKRLAEHKTRAKFGEEAGASKDRLLSDEDDLSIWGEYGSLFRQMLPYLLNQGRPQQWFFDFCASEYFIHSKTMKNLAVSLLPQVEAALQRQPKNVFLWQAWATMSNLVEGRQFRDVMETIVFSPLTHPMDYMPAYIRARLCKQYRANQNWQGIADVQEMYWESWSNYLGPMPGQWINVDLWNMNGMSDLLEAYLRLNKDYEADEFVRIWSQSPYWSQIKPSAIDLAERCGKTGLAGSWKLLN